MPRLRPASFTVKPVSPPAPRPFRLGALCLLAFLSVTLSTAQTIAQSAQQLLDKALAIHTATTSLDCTCLSREIDLKLFHTEDQPPTAFRYAINNQAYGHKEIRRRPPDDWAIIAATQSFGIGQDFSYPSTTQTVLLKTKDRMRIGRDSPTGTLKLFESSSENFTQVLRRALTGAERLEDMNSDLVLQQLDPDVRKLGNRLWGLYAPELLYSETAQDATTTFCIRAKNNNSDTVFIWLNTREFHITRIIALPKAPIPYGNLADGYVTTSLNFHEYVYTYHSTQFPTNDSFTSFPDTTIDFVSPANRAPFLDISEIITLASDQFALTASHPLLKPRVDKHWSADLRKGLLIVETGKGKVSGFIVRIKGSDFAVTNLRAINSDSKITLRSMAGTEIPYTALYGAIGRDIALFSIAKTEGALRLASDVGTSSKPGQRIVILGNQPDNDAINDHVGTLMHIGPDRIETDGVYYPGAADTLPRSSGSPIISDETGEVLAVATHTSPCRIDVVKSIQLNQNFDRQSTWFGFRLDGNPKWQLINRTSWNDQRNRIEKFRSLSETLLLAMKLRVEDLKDEPRMLSVFSHIIHITPAPAKDSPFYTEEAKSIAKSLRLMAEEDVPAMASTGFYDYFRTCFYWDQNALDQLKYRASIIDELKHYEKTPASFSERLRDFVAWRQK